MKCMFSIPMHFRQKYLSFPNLATKIFSQNRYRSATGCEKRTITTKKQFLEDVKKLQSLNDKYDTECARLHQVGFTDAPVIDAADRITCFAVDLLADKYDISRDAMDWFVWENNFGKSGLSSAWPDKKEKKIKNASAFWKFEKEGKK